MRSLFLLWSKVFPLLWGPHGSSSNFTIIITRPEAKNKKSLNLILIDFCILFRDIRYLPRGIPRIWNTICYHNNDNILFSVFLQVQFSNSWWQKIELLNPRRIFFHFLYLGLLLRPWGLGFQPSPILDFVYLDWVQQDLKLCLRREPFRGDS